MASPEKMRFILTKARQIVELNGMQMVYFIGYDPQTKQFGALIGDKTNERERLMELLQYCTEQLNHVQPPQLILPH